MWLRIESRMSLDSRDLRKFQALTFSTLPFVQSDLQIVAAW
jgi:hypothetical protein